MKDSLVKLISLGFSDLAVSLEDPSPHEWKEIAKRLDAEQSGVFADRNIPTLLPLIRSALKFWPRELPRDPLPHWTNLQHRDLLKLCLKVREVDTYEYYLTAIHSAPELKNNGLPSVRLQRFFAGGAKVGKGDAWVKIGQAGQADFVGVTSVEVRGVRHEVALTGWADRLGPSADALRINSEPSLIGVYTELEIKLPKGSQSEAQRIREQVIRSRGGIYLVAKSVKEAIRLLVGERERLREMWN